MLAALAVAAATLLAIPSMANAQTAPDPSRSGPNSVTNTTVSSLAVGSGFGGGRLSYPTSGSNLGAIALSPGVTASASSIGWLGPRLASHGFVVLIIETNSRSDQPDSRARQLQSALDYLTQRSAVQSRIDSSKIGVGGHSMGGGGSLRASANNSRIRASVPLAPWHSTKSWGSVRVPTLILAGSSDTVASSSSHANRFYSSLGSPNKALIERRGAGHFFPQSSSDWVSRYTVAWYKRFIDGDTRYDSSICTQVSGLSQYRTTCPLSGGGTTPTSTPTTPTTAPPSSGCSWWTWWRC